MGQVRKWLLLYDAFAALYLIFVRPWVREEFAADFGHGMIRVCDREPTASDDPFLR